MISILIIFLQVAISVYFLAEMYYDMEENGKSEELFLRSIRIMRKHCELRIMRKDCDLEDCYNGLIQAS